MEIINQNSRVFTLLVCEQFWRRHQILKDRNTVDDGEDGIHDSVLQTVVKCLNEWLVRRIQLSRERVEAECVTER